MLLQVGTRVYIWFLVDDKSLAPYHGTITRSMQESGTPVYSIAYANGEFESIRHLYSDDENLKKEGGWTIDTINTPLKPLFWWMGGKSKELGNIMRYLPESFDCYVEPFAGSAALMCMLAPKRIVLNDINTNIAKFYQDIANGLGPVIYNKVTSSRNSRSQLCPSSLFLLERVNSFRGLPGTKTKCKSGARLACMDIIKRLKDDRYARLLEKAVIQNTDFGNTMADYNNENTFMFLDPPYIDTQPYDVNEPFTLADHQRLCNIFKSTKSKCLMVVQKHEMMMKLYHAHIKGEYETRYNPQGKCVTHLVISNYGQ